MKWPADRKFTDAQGKILDHWRGPMGVLEPLLALTPSQFVALKEMLAAFLEQDDDADPGTSINLALPIDTEPLPDEDWLIEYKNSANAGRRVLISTLLALVPASSTLISTTPLSGLGSVDIPVPGGFRDIEVRVTNLSMSTTATPLISYSEDGGATFLSQLFQIFTNGFAQSGTSTTPTFSVTTGLTAATVISGVSKIRDYQSTDSKLACDFGLYSTTGVAWTGSRYMAASVAPINLINFSSSAGTFDLGTIELIGFR